MRFRELAEKIKGLRSQGAILVDLSDHLNTLSDYDQSAVEAINKKILELMAEVTGEVEELENMEVGYEPRKKSKGKRGRPKKSE